MTFQQAEGRDRRHRRARSVRRTAAVLASRYLGPASRSKSGIRPRGLPRAAALVIVDVRAAAPRPVCRAKTEQADLLRAMFGRNGEAPVPIVAPAPRRLLRRRRRGRRIATTYRTPVFLLSDGYVANGSRPWRIPGSTTCHLHRVRVRAQPPPARTAARVLALPARDPGPSRPWAVPGTGARAPHRRHRERPTASATSPTTPTTTTAWCGCARPEGSTASPSPASGRRPPRATPEVPRAGVGLDVRPDHRPARSRGARALPVAQAPPAPPQPVPGQHREVLRRYKVVIPEMNLGQLALLIRAAASSSMRSPTTRSRQTVQGRGASPESIRSTWSPVSEAVELPFPSLRLVRRPTKPQTAKDFKTDQEVRWCPGCGDYAILAGVQRLPARTRRLRENIVFGSPASAAQPVPVLHEHLRGALDPRPRAGDRHGPVDDARPCRCGSSPATATRCRSAATT